jgi:hypothetical protein
MMRARRIHSSGAGLPGTGLRPGKTVNDCQGSRDRKRSPRDIGCPRRRGEEFLSILLGGKTP